MGNIKICVIGAGRWGKNHIRTLFELGALGGVVDPDAQQRNKIKDLFPQTACFDSLENAFQYFIDVIRGKKIDKATFDDGLDVVKILEMATNSLTNKTLPVSHS